MPELTLRKVPFYEDSENRLRMLKARTGLDRNYLCRIGFCLSLEEPGTPAIIQEKIKPSREIDRYTLLGQYGQVYLSLLITWMKDNGLNPTLPGEIDNMLIVHMNRGVELVASRVKSLVDLGSLSQQIIDPSFEKAASSAEINSDNIK